MAVSVCADCGRPLGGFVRVMNSKKCLRCGWLSYERAAGFFQRCPAPEQALVKPFGSSVRLLAGSALLWIGLYILGTLVGYGSGGALRGLVYAYGFALLGTFAFRHFYIWRPGAHPWDILRWFEFTAVYSIGMLFVWLAAYAAFMPGAGAYQPRALFSYHVRLFGQFSLPGFVLLTASALLGGLILFGLGLRRVKTSEEKNRQHLEMLLQRWRQAARG